MRNFSDGVFAFGIFFGYIFAAISFLVIFDSLRIEESTLIGFLGVLVGAFSTFFATAWLRISEANDRIVGLITMFLVKNHQLKIFIALMQDSLSDSKKNSGKTQSLSRFSSFHYMLNFNSVPRNLIPGGFEAEEVEASLRLLPDGEKGEFLKTIRRVDVVINNYFAVQSFVSRVREVHGFNEATKLGEKEISMNEADAKDLAAALNEKSDMIIELEQEVDRLLRDLLLLSHKLRQATKEKIRREITIV